MKISSWACLPLLVAPVAGADEIYVGRGGRVSADVAAGAAEGDDVDSGVMGNWLIQEALA